MDTAYITTQVRQYVQCLGADVLCPKGTHTAELRYQWGLNTVLRHDDEDIKNREDHRHHAVDAIVIALTNPSRLQKLAAIRREGGTESTGEILPDPWSGFRTEVEKVVHPMLVSHRVRRRVAGPLHKDTVFGRGGKEGEFVYRKPLASLSPPMVLKIRDRAIRELVIARLKEFGIEPQRGAEKIKADVWKEPLVMPSGVPIKKVRITTTNAAVRSICNTKTFVEPGSTHHVCLFEIQDQKGKTKRLAQSVTMIEAIERVKKREPLIQRTHPDHPQARFLMSLSGNEMLMLKHNGREGLFRFETAASTSGQMWFRHHTFAGKSSDKRLQVSKMPNTFDGRKVVVDPLGRLRWAND